MRAKLKGAAVALALLVAGVLVSPSAQVAITSSFSKIITVAGIGTTSTDGMEWVNPTAAAAGAQQYSPRTCWQGQGWKTDATAASQSVEFCLETQPVEGTSAPTGNFILKASINGGAFSTVGTFTSDGAFTSTGIITGSQIYSGASVNVAAGQYLNFSGRGGITDASNGAFLFSNSTGSNTALITLADWGTTQSAEAVSVANAGTLTLGTATAGSCTVSYPGDAAIYLLRGTSNATTLVSGSATFTVTKDNAATVNVYYDTTGYFLQNNSGGALSFRVLCSGG